MESEPKVILFNGTEYSQEEFSRLFNTLFLTELEKVKGAKHVSNHIKLL